MKKISLILAVILVLSCLLAACGSKDDGNVSTNKDGHIGSTNSSTAPASNSPLGTVDDVMPGFGDNDGDTERSTQNRDESNTTNRTESTSSASSED